MNDLKISRGIIGEIFDEKSFNEELVDFLNSVIDDEYLKDQPDCDLIDECIDLLDQIDSGDYSNVIPFMNKNRLVPGKRRIISILVACAVILSAGFGAVAVGYNIEKKRAEETDTTTTEASTSQTTTVTETTVIAEPSPVRLHLSFGTDFRDEYKFGEKPDLKGITVKLELSDGTEKELALSECKVIVGDSFGREEKYETVTLEYGKVQASFKVRVLRDVDTRVLNSIYAAFSNDFDFTCESIDDIDLSDMQVYAVYSDKSETEIKDYTVEQELLPDGKTKIITIKYEDCYSTFGIKEKPHVDIDE